MALLDIFKKSNKEEANMNSGEKKPALEKKQNVSSGKEKPKVKEDKVKKAIGTIHEALISPHITEKATILNEENKYVFKVWPKINKIEVKKAIEHTYGVDVIGVRIVNIHRKKRKVGKSTGWVKGYKKAIVKIKEGQRIEILSR